MTAPTSVRVLPAVQAALDAGNPVVALESTVYSTLGLPVPHNREVLHASRRAIAEHGVTPALTAVIDGVPSAVSYTHLTLPTICSV